LFLSSGAMPSSDALGGGLAMMLVWCWWKNDVACFERYKWEAAGVCAADVQTEGATCARPRLLS
jgi:hypothetical protein